MPTKPAAKARDPTIHSITHIEITSTQPEKLKAFFEQQFGWQFQTHKMPAGEYHLFKTPNGNAGGVTAPMPQQPIAATPYINVEDIDATQQSCKKAGATILMPVTEVPGQGKFFWFQVAGSPPLACWQQTGPRN
jgi:predicted enzyme related to lactoylglutathione lyase